MIFESDALSWFPTSQKVSAGLVLDARTFVVLRGMSVLWLVCSTRVHLAYLQHKVNKKTSWLDDRCALQLGMDL